MVTVGKIVAEETIQAAGNKAVLREGLEEGGRVEP